MAASAEPPAYSLGYSGFCVSSSSFTNIMLPFNMEASISLPPSPSSSHSSLSLEPLTSCQLPDTLSYTHLLSTSDTDIPSLLDTPSSSSSLSHLSKAPSLSTVRKRPASFLCELEACAELQEGSLMGKRICDLAVLDESILYRSRDASSSDRDTTLPNDAHNNELQDGPVWRNGACAENMVSSKDLDDMLDILLQEAEVAPISSVQSTSLGCHESSNLLAYKIDHCREESKEVLSKLDYCKEESKDLYTKSSSSHQSNHFTGSVRSTRTWSDTFQDGIRGSQKSMVGNPAREGPGLRRRTEVDEANAMRSCEELLKQIAPTCGTPKQEQIDIKEEKLQEEQSKTKQQVVQTRWAGPTLLDIESALAMTSPPSSTYPFGKPPPFTSSSFLCSIRDILQQDPPPHFVSSIACKEDPTLEEDDKLSTWRRLQKRNHMEPRYTVKIRCEEDGVHDGYRWRKYGQKSIKNSPYPRSYYRCSSGKCSVKKQVERSGEDAGLLLVSYEGIHLHHRPTSLLSPTLPHVSPSPSHV